MNDSWTRACLAGVCCAAALGAVARWTTRSLAATRGANGRAVRAIRELIEPPGRWIALAAWILHYANGTKAGGAYVNGRRHGTWTLFLPERRDHNVVREAGPYVNGQRHGTWTGYDASGNVVGTRRFEIGRQVGSSGSAVDVSAAATSAPLQPMSPAARSPLGRVRRRRGLLKKVEFGPQIQQQTNIFRRNHSRRGLMANSNIHRSLMVLLGIALGACGGPAADEAEIEAESNRLSVELAELSTKWPGSTCRPVPMNRDDIDADRDLVLDECEFDVAHAFRPVLVFHPEEDAESRETYWAVKPLGAYSLKIFYALAYHHDTGYAAGATAHAGDSEVIAISVTSRAGGWTADSVTISAHSNNKSIAVDSLTWYEDRDRGRPIMWVARGKHANYESSVACENHNLDSCEAASRLEESRRWDDVEVWRGANLGSSDVPLVNCVWSREGYPGVECFWDDRIDYGFRGWQRDSELQPSVYRLTTPYGVILDQYGFGAEG